MGGISGYEGVDGPGGGGRSSFEVSVPQQRGDEQNERGHDSLAQNDWGVNNVECTIILRCPRANRDGGFIGMTPRSLRLL